MVALYNSWAKDGRDVVMEATQGATADEMISFILNRRHAEEGELKGPHHAIDAGCGNGWLARRFASACQTTGEQPSFHGVLAVDAASLMIAKATSLEDVDRKKRKPGDCPVEYLVADVQTWRPPQRVNVVFASELLFFLDDPRSCVAHWVDSWLMEGGRVIASVECHKVGALISRRFRVSKRSGSILVMARIYNEGTGNRRIICMVGH